MWGYHMCSWVLAQHVWLPAGWWLWFLLLWERTMSKTFYCSCWPFLYLLWENVYSFLVHFKKIFLFLSSPFFPSFPFPSFLYPSTSLILLLLSFFCLIYGLLIYLGFNTFYVWITNFMLLPWNVFSFCWLLPLLLIWWLILLLEQVLLCVTPGKYQDQCHGVSPLSSRWDVISALKFKFLIHSELGIRKKSNFILFPVTIWLSQHHQLKRLSFNPQCMLGVLSGDLFPSHTPPAFPGMGYSSKCNW